jgi:hypothetical protein
MFQDDPGDLSAAAQKAGNPCILHGGITFSKLLNSSQIYCCCCHAHCPSHVSNSNRRPDLLHPVCAADCLMYILEGQAQVLLWVPRFAGEDTADPLPTAWSEDSLAPEALQTAGSQAGTHDSTCRALLHFNHHDPFYSTA